MNVRDDIYDVVEYVIGDTVVVVLCCVVSRTVARAVQVAVHGAIHDC